MAKPHRPRKRFGQHFLHDPAVIDRIVSSIRPTATDRMIEIGPGPGALTDELVQRVASLTVIEIDRDLAAALRDRYESVASLTVVEADALEWSPQTGEQGLRILGNLPYNVSTPLLFRLDRYRTQIADACFMLQKEVVMRMVANPGSKTYGRLSVMLQYGWEMERLFDVGPGAFQPPPKVSSSIVTMRPREPELKTENPDYFAAIVRAAFAQRRKTLRNALSDIISADSIEAAGINPGDRAERLTPTQFVELSLQKPDKKA